MIAWLAPGGGSQHERMFERGDAELLRAAFAQASTALGFDLPDCLLDPAFAASSEGMALRLLVCGFAAGRELRKAGIPAHAFAGHSLGAFTAATLAGVIPFERACVIVYDRARRMREAFTDGYGMAAVAGLPRSTVERIVAETGGTAVQLYRSNVNGARSVTLSGSLRSLDVAMRSALENGAGSARLLDVAVPSHCALMSDVARELSVRYGGEPVHEPSVPVAANAGGRLLRKGRDIFLDALTNVERGVRWDLAMQTLIEAGITAIVELRPGHVLTDLFANESQAVRAVALEDASALDCARLFGALAKRS